MSARQSDPPGLVQLVVALIEAANRRKAAHGVARVSAEYDEAKAYEALLACDLSAPASPAPEHRCGVHGFDQMRGDVCPACSARHASPAPMPPVEVGDVVLLESGGVEYVRTKHAEDYWTGADAEGFPDVAERRKARILAIYRDPLWRRPAPMPTKGDE